MVDRIEFVGDCALIWDPTTCTYGVCPLEHLTWKWSSIDLSDPDTARWVDRKIAEHFMTSQYVSLVRSAVLGCTEDVFFIALLGPCGQHSEMALRPHGLLSCLRSIRPTEANIPTARAALLKALFGREKT